MRSTEALPGPQFAVLGLLALAMGHDVENLLLGARACVQRLGRTDLAAEERRRYVDATVDALDQLSQMHTRLAEAIPGAPSTVEPRALLDRGLERVRPLACARGVILEAAVEGDPHARCHDDGDLSYALTAVLVDLVRALPRGGRVVVRTRPRDDHLLFELRSRRPPDEPGNGPPDFLLARALPAVGMRLEVGAGEAGAVVATLPVPLALAAEGPEDATSDPPEPSATQESGG